MDESKPGDGREDRSSFEVVSVGEARARFGFGPDQRPILRLDPQRVPPNLHDLIPLAEKWGIADDLVREACASNAEAGELDELVKRVKMREDELDEWLAGPEAEVKDPSSEYVAFSALAMLFCDLSSSRRRK